MRGNHGTSDKNPVRIIPQKAMYPKRSKKMHSSSELIALLFTTKLFRQTRFVIWVLIVWHNIINDMIGSSRCAVIVGSQIRA